MTEFKTGSWQKFVDVRDFIVRNYTPYDGDDSFLYPSYRADQSAVE